jgi:hypothetical protein
MSNTESKSESKEATPQVFHATITHQQRFMLVQLISSSQAALVQGAAERMKMKNFRAAFGLEPIFEAAKADGTVNPLLSTSKKGSAFMLTLENVEFFLDVLMERLPMSGPQALAIEPLIDDLSDARKKPGIGSLPTVEELYAPETESWAPPAAKA